MNSQKRKYIGQDPKGSQVQEPLVSGVEVHHPLGT